MAGISNSPAENHLFFVFTVDLYCLNTEDAEFFHTMVATLLFLTKQARPGIKLEVSFYVQG
jgi:hypothetical protein